MYLYFINYQDTQKEVCELEMKRLFNTSLTSIIESYINYSESRSAFFKSKLDIIVKEKEYDTFINKLSTICVDKFKVEYIKYKEDGLDYSKRMDLVRECAKCIQGIGSLDNDAVRLGIVYFNHCFYLGRLYEDHQTWQQYQNKPQSYSQSLSVRDARSLINIATGGKDITIVDPCCGVGTILLEAKQMGHKIDGYEINKGVAWKANRNLEYFGYPKIVQNQDMHTITKHYDVSILDIPYNLYSSITLDEQKALIRKCHDISNNFVLISYEEFDDILKENNFQIIEKVKIKKIKMVRYIYYCEVVK